MKALKALYTATKRNKVICYGTNLASFHRKLKALEPNARSLSYYQKHFIFNWEDHFSTDNETVVYIQKLK